MLKKDVEVGAIYRVRWHDGTFTEVKILGPKPAYARGGYSGSVTRRTQYNALNLKTGRMVVIKSAAKLRERVA